MPRPSVPDGNLSNELLLGFDLRVGPERHANVWDHTRSNNYLLRTIVGGPLSVDDTVWPSVFDHGQGIGLSDEDRSRFGYTGIPLPSWTGPNGGLWDDLGAMLRHAVAGGETIEGAALIAVTVMAPNSIRPDDDGPYAGETLPETLDSHWALAGYDVADRWRLSGLANCGYAPSEAEEWRRKWGPILNRHHLFSEESQAQSFRWATDRRVPEHAPFLVYALHIRARTVVTR